MFLANSEIRELGDKIKTEFGSDVVSKKDRIEVKEDVIYRDGEPIFFYKESLNDRKIKILTPHLKLLQKNNFLKKITVDMPAVPFMIKGADVMRPGIKEIDDGIKKGDLVSIVDENNKKAVAVGICEYGSEEMRTIQKGKVIRNIHWVGDERWNVK